MADPAPTKILYCHCAYAMVVPNKTKEGVLRGLIASGREFESVADLCEMSARGADDLKRLADSEGEIRIAACYPRVVKWLFHQGGAPLAEGKYTVCNMRVDPPDQVVAELLGQEQEQE